MLAWCACASPFLALKFWITQINVVMMLYFEFLSLTFLLLNHQRKVSQSQILQVVWKVCPYKSTHRFCWSFFKISDEECKRGISKLCIEGLWLMGMKMQSQHQHHPVALRLHEQTGSKTKYTFIQAKRAWLPKFLLLWIMLMMLFSGFIYNRMDDDNKVRRREVLGSLCEQRARMLQDQFSVSVNHVHALAILVSTFHYYRDPSAIDQVCAWLWLEFSYFDLWLEKSSISIYDWWYLTFFPMVDY